MEVMILGGDGFCGWPTALYLSSQGHNITIIDNLSRRNIDHELMAGSLTPIEPIDIRISAWEAISQKKIKFINLNVATQYDILLNLISYIRPNTIIHFAEQRAAPYSMKTPKHKRYTVDNNISATHNLLCAVTESRLNPHVIHLGTMGVYGYDHLGADMELPEGYLTVKVPLKEGQDVEQTILHPTNAGSVYHMTKCLDQLLFKFYNKNDGIRVTDLHQGIVWGIQTKQTLQDSRLMNRFDYDGDYGTVLNRFLMQAAVGHPLTVHGTGGQTRAFIHITDSARCIELAMLNPPKEGDPVAIYNQTTETFRVRDLAILIAEKFGAGIEYVKNPRNEKDENELRVKCSGLKELGLKPTYLKEGLLSELYDVAIKYKNRYRLEKIPCESVW